MYQVIKRDGKLVEFDITKIAAAIKKAFEATSTDYNDSVIDFLALKVSADFLPKIKDSKVAVEDVQDSVEAVLSRGGYEAVAKAYILYRKQREKLRNTKSSYLDYKETVDKYLNIEDWRVKENSTVTYSVGGLILSNSGAITATTGSARFMTRRSPTPTATATCICMTCQCSPATAPAGA